MGQSEADDGAWYSRKVTDTTEQYHGEYEYEFAMINRREVRLRTNTLIIFQKLTLTATKPSLGQTESCVFPHLNDPSPEEEQEELRQIVAENSRR